MTMNITTESNSTNNIIVHNGPPWPILLRPIYITLASVAATMCCVSLFAICRTRKTVYSTKMFSSGLLTFDILFLVCSSISKFMMYEDSFLLQHLVRGFHVSSWIIVGSMAIERLCAINWPYKYLKFATNKRIRTLCLAIFAFSFGQYAVVRSWACYATRTPVHCGMGLKVYLLMIFILMPTISFLAYGKVYKIINRNTERISHRHRMSDFKGTYVSFMYLINMAVSSLIYCGAAVIIFLRFYTDEKDGKLATFADFVNLLNCLVDPLIYVVGIREARLELLKLTLICSARFKTKIYVMETEVFNIQTYLPRAKKLKAIYTHRAFNGGPRFGLRHYEISMSTLFWPVVGPRLQTRCENVNGRFISVVQTRV